MDSPLKREFQYYLDHQDELVQKYRGQVVAIKDQHVLGAYPDEATAIRESRRQHELGTFLVQRVEPGEGEYSQTFHSRVAFAR